MCDNPFPILDMFQLSVSRMKSLLFYGLIYFVNNNLLKFSPIVFHTHFSPYFGKHFLFSCICLSPSFLYFKSFLEGNAI